MSKPMDKQRMETLTKAYLATMKHLNARSVIVSIEGLDEDGGAQNGVFAMINGPLDGVAAMVRGINEAVLKNVKPECRQEFCHLIGARIVHSQEEMERLLTMDTGSEGEVFEMTPTSYRSKTVH